MPATATPAATPGAHVNETTQPASTITAVAWLPKREMDIAEWSRAGHRLSVMSRCSPWWLGDWIHYGNAKFGEKYSRAAKITGYDAQTLMNMVYVASHFEASRRREELSWSHHETVTSLSSDEQDRWLTRAIDDKLSVADLRLELRSCRKGKQALSHLDTTDGNAGEENTVVMSVTCPNCGHQIPSAMFARLTEESPDVGSTAKRQAQFSTPVLTRYAGVSDGHHRRPSSSTGGARKSL